MECAHLISDCICRWLPRDSIWDFDGAQGTIISKTSTMNRLLGIAFLYLAMMLGWIGVGLFMLFAPGRVGNLIHDSLMLFPAVSSGDWGKKLFHRLVGLGLIAFAIRFVVQLMYL